MEIPESNEMVTEEIDFRKDKYPFCIVWTPIPLLTWLFPFIGHMGIAMSSGVIRDFAGPYYVSEDNMAFGRPTKYWQLRYSLARGGISGWDSGVTEASEIYKTRMHNLCCDNCHSHVATALNLMQYNKSTSWNMVKLAILMLLYSKYVSFTGFLKTWLPFVFIVIVSLTIFLTVR
ncbi:transmembrane protein 222 [Diorhabda sublineata]|uniref:transmembrane protein 222 n=1 Tax=Diorhabda sublineata TaxID=1163346 RepID=UPI0024E17D94|nr:transmembrane protein 222 [Diorhabda sublineata]